MDTVTAVLELVVATEPPTITKLPASLGDVVGSSISLSCTATGVPLPRVTFRRGDQEFAGAELETTDTSVTSELTLDPLTPDEEGVYTCLAVNEYGSKRQSAEISVYARTAVSLVDGSLTVFSGEVAAFPCTVTVDPRLQPSLEVSWLRGQHQVTSDGDRVTATPAELVINSTVAKDEGRYTCSATTSHDQASATGQLTVLIERPSFTSTPLDVKVLEGSSTTLDCQASGIPAPIVTWTYGDRLLEAQGGRLELRDVARNMEGKYVCTASNMYGEVEEIVTVEVIQGVRKGSSAIPDIIRNNKETVQLPCDFEVDSRVEEETEFHWLKDEEELEYLEDKFELLTNKSLVIKDLALVDMGRYTCRVTNSLEQKESSHQLIVSGLGPQIINNFQKTTVYEGEDLQLECIAQGSPQPSLRWLVREQPVVKKYLVDTQAAKSEFIEQRVRILKVTRAHEGLYQCVANNSEGTVAKNAQVEVISRTRVSITSEEGDPEMRVQAGKQVKLPCKVDHDMSNRITNLEWTKDGERISPGGEDRIDYGMDGSITIFDVKTRHQGVYRCAVTTVRDDAFAEVPLKVIVNAPVITKHSPDVRVFSGTSLELECESTGIPQPEVRWTLNRTVTMVRGATFPINAAIAGVDSGDYQCTATNSVGMTDRTIRVAVVTLPTLQDEYRVKKGRRLALQCLPSSPEVTTVWRRGEEVVEGDQEGRLVLHEVMEVDEGEHTCEVTITASGEVRVLETTVRWGGGGGEKEGKKEQGV